MVATGETERLYALLTCPRCGTSPRAAHPNCPGCGRPVVTPGGSLDLLDDDARVAAERFAASYRALRASEGWAGTNGQEEPGERPSGRWRHRLRSVSKAAAILAQGWTAGSRPVVADVGSGGGLAASLLEGADVIAFDLVDARPTIGALTVRADMTRLPLRDGSLDGAMYSASLHYAPIDKVVSEVARVLRTSGTLVAVDSPIYSDPQSRAEAVARTTAYYTRAGHPELAAHYHPIELTALRSALTANGFQVERLDAGRPGGIWMRLMRRPPSSLVVARLLG